MNRWRSDLTGCIVSWLDALWIVTRRQVYHDLPSLGRTGRQTLSCWRLEPASEETCLSFGSTTSLAASPDYSPINFRIVNVTHRLDEMHILCCYPSRTVNHKGLLGQLMLFPVFRKFLGFRGIRISPIPLSISALPKLVGGSTESCSWLSKGTGLMSLSLSAILVEGSAIFRQGDWVSVD